MAAPASPAASAVAVAAGYGILCLIWGSTWLGIRVLVHDVPPLWGAALRFALAALLLIAWALVRRLPLPPTARAWRANLVLGMTMVALPYGLLFWAEQHITSSLTAVLYSCLPLVVALLTPWMTEHRVPRRAVFAMVVGAGGIAVLFYRGLPETTTGSLAGVAVLAAVVSTSWSSIYARTEIAAHDPAVSTAIQITVGAHLLFLGSAVLERQQPARWTPHSLLALLYLAVAGTAVAFALYYWVLRHMLPYQLSTLNLIVPVVAIVLGWLLLDEAIPPVMLAAAAVVLGAVASVLRAQAEVPSSLRLSREAE